MMATAIELAMQRAQQEREARLRDSVAQWSRDDTVHSDPPLPPAPAPSYWPLLHADQPPATPTEPTKENPVAQEFNQSTNNHQSTNTAPPPPSEGKAFTLPNPEQVGVTEACQMAVRDNPGAGRGALMAALVDAGYKATSVSSTFGMLVIQKIIRTDENNLVWPRYKRYRKLLSHDKWVKEHPEYATRSARKKAGKVAVKKTPHESPGRIAAAYANAVRWAREKGQPTPVWSTWVQEFRFRAKYPVTNHDVEVAEQAIKAGTTPREVVERPRRAAMARLGQKPAKLLDTAASRTDPTGPSVREMTPQQIVDELSLVQARGLLKLLQAAFGA